MARKKRQSGIDMKYLKAAEALNTVASSGWVVNQQIFRVHERDVAEVVDNRDYMVNRYWIGIGYTKKTRE